jgi:hypothetical protein
MANRKSGNRPENARVGEIYLIRHIGTDTHKIGITLDWYRRAEQLDVGLKAEEVAVARVLFPGKLEKKLHRRYDKQRLPQSEWFHLTVEQVEEVVQVFLSEGSRYKASLEPTTQTPSPRQPAPYRIIGGDSVHQSPEPAWIRADQSRPMQSEIRSSQAKSHFGRPVSTQGASTPSKAKVLPKPSWKDSLITGFLVSIFLPLWTLPSIAAKSSSPNSFLPFLVFQIWLVAVMNRGNGFR